MGAGLSPFPYALIFPQDEHERLLIDRLAQAGVQVERGIELAGLRRHARPRASRASRRPTDCRNVRGGLHRRLRRRPFHRAPGPGDRLPRRHLRPSLLRRRRRRLRRHDQRRTPRRPRQDRLPRGLPTPRPRPRPPHRHRARRGRDASTSSSPGTTSARASSTASASTSRTSTGSRRTTSTTASPITSAKAARSSSATPPTSTAPSAAKA